MGGLKLDSLRKNLGRVLVLHCEHSKKKTVIGVAGKSVSESRLEACLHVPES